METLISLNAHNTMLHLARSDAMSHLVACGFCPTAKLLTISAFPANPEIPLIY
jgi:hypothetical protein